MQTISIHNFQIPAPSNLSELSKKQCKLLAGAIYHNLELPRLQILMFISFMQENMNLKERCWYLWHIVMWPYFVKRTWLGRFLFQRLNLNTKVRVLSDEALIELSDSHTDFLFDEKGVISEQKFKRFLFWKGYYNGPSNSLSNLCFRQFRMAEEFSLLYAASKNETHLNTMLAWLYLPGNAYELEATNKEYRKYLTPTEVKKRAKNIAKIDIETRYYLYLWYCNAKSALQKKFYEIWEAPSGTSKTKINQNLLDKLRQNFSSMLVLRAEHVTRLEDTDFSMLFDVLQFFQSEIIQAKAARKNDK